MSSTYGAAASVRSTRAGSPCVKPGNFDTSMSTTSGTPWPEFSASCSLLCMSSYGITLTSIFTCLSGFSSFQTLAMFS